MAAPICYFNVKPADNDSWQVDFSDWQHIATDGLQVTAGAFLAWLDNAPGTLGSITVGADNKSLVIPASGFADQTRYTGRFTVTFTGGIVREFQVIWTCKIRNV